MRSRRWVGSMALTLCLVALVGCQAPGFMGLSGNTTPDAASDGQRIVRARFRVLVPPSMAQGLSVAPETPQDATASGNGYQDQAVVGAKIFLDGQPNVYDTTDEWGQASLGVPQGRLVPVRAEFRTPSGTVAMTSLIRVSPEAQAAPLFNISVASTLVTSKVAQRFKYEELRLLDATKVQTAIEAVDLAIRTPRGDYDPQYVPNLNRQWSILDTARTIARVDPILTEALADVLAAVIPSDDPASGSVASRSIQARLATASLTLASAPPATASGEASASPDASESATASLAASSSLEPIELYAMEAGRIWSYTLFDAAGKPAGHLTRRVDKVLPRSGGIWLIGSEAGQIAQDDVSWTFQARRTAERLRMVASFRPMVEYPLQLLDGLKWQAGPGIKAVARAQAAKDSMGAAWRIDFVQTGEGHRQAWSEWLQPGVGFVRYQWYDVRTGRRWEARLEQPSPEPSAP